MLNDCEAKNQGDNGNLDNIGPMVAKPTKKKKRTVPTRTEAERAALATWKIPPNSGYTGHDDGKRTLIRSPLEFQMFATHVASDGVGRYKEIALLRDLQAGIENARKQGRRNWEPALRIARLLVDYIDYDEEAGYSLAEADAKIHGDPSLPATIYRELDIDFQFVAASVRPKDSLNLYGRALSNLVVRFGGLKIPDDEAALILQRYFNEVITGVSRAKKRTGDDAKATARVNAIASLVICARVCGIESEPTAKRLRTLKKAVSKEVRGPLK